MTTLIEEPQVDVQPEKKVNHNGKRSKNGCELRMISQIEYYDMDYIIFYFVSNVNIITRKTWESMGKSRLVWSHVQLRLSN